MRNIQVRISDKAYEILSANTTPKTKGEFISRLIENYRQTKVEIIDELIIILENKKQKK